MYRNQIHGTWEVLKTIVASSSGGLVGENREDNPNTYVFRKSDEIIVAKKLRTKI